MPANTILNEYHVKQKKGGPGTCFIKIQVLKCWAVSEGAQQVQAFAGKTDNLNLTSGTHMVQRENQLEVVL